MTVSGIACFSPSDQDGQPETVLGLFQDGTVTNHVFNK